MRFIAPSLAVLMASIAVLGSEPLLAIGMASLLSAVSLGTGFGRSGLVSLMPATGLFLVVLAAAFLVFHFLNRSGRMSLFLLIVIALGLRAYVAWTSYLNMCRADAVETWSQTYGPLADGWGAVRDQTEPDSIIAYTNTIQIYPLYGFDLGRHLVYIPTRPGVHQLSDLPKMRPVIGEDVPGEVSRIMMENSDRQTWLDNLKHSGANYLFIAKQNLADPAKAAHPPELDYITPDRFQLMFENEAVSIYRVKTN
jgi:hypothetical protein